MYTNRSCLPPFYVLVVALLLLDTISNGQLVSSSQDSLEQTSRSNETLSSNALKEYVIYSVVEGASRDLDNERVRLHLEMLLAPAAVQEYGGDYTGVEFWRVKMNDLQRTAFVGANPKPQIHENTQLLYHEDLEGPQDLSQNTSELDQSFSAMRNGTSVYTGLSARTIYQSDAPSDLKVVSWAPGVPFRKTTKSYAYDTASGEKSVVYVIENGIQGDDREFLWPPPHWLYAPSVRRTETDDDPYSHGSCVASKATGIQNGVSKTSQLVVVKSSLNVVDIAWAFQKIVNDVAQQRQRRVVVLLAATTLTAWRPEAFQDARLNRIYLRMKNLIDLGAVVVVPSGDYAQRSSFADTVPAVFASSFMLGHKQLPLIVAGAVDNSGAEASWSQSTINGMVWAPGVKVTCTKRGWHLRSTETGTSVSAGMVAGLAAYFLGMKNPPFAIGGQDTSYNLIQYLQTSASWARPSGKRRVIWNRLDGSLDGSLIPLLNTSAAVGDDYTASVAQERI